MEELLKETVADLKRSIDRTSLSDHSSVTHMIQECRLYLARIEYYNQQN